MGDDQLPSASIAIPVRNEEASIRSCLRAVLAQDYPGLLEVLVADGSSSDRTRELVEEIAEGSVVPIRLLENPDATTPAGLNRALSSARGDFFVRVDGHSIVQPSYVRRCIEGAVALDAALAGGWVEPAGTNAFGRAVAAAFSSPFAMGNAVSWRKPAEPREVGSVPCGAYRADLLRRIGGFDEEQLTNQDYEANYRLRRSGGTVWLLPDVSFRYESRASLRRLAHQFARYGFYKARTMIKHPSSVRPRHLLPSALLVAAIALAVAAPLSTFALKLLVVCALLYAAAVAAATVVAGRGLGAAVVLRLPVVFVAMHACWGAGNVAGLVRFVPRRRAIRTTMQPLSV